VEALMTPRTRVVCLELVNFNNGFRAPIEEIARLCHQRGAWLVVDAVQAAGALRIDAPALGADLVAAPPREDVVAPVHAATDGHGDTVESDTAATDNSQPVDDDCVLADHVSLLSHPGDLQREMRADEFRTAWPL